MSQSRTILISGGGIAGLAAALAISKRGYRADVFEKALEIETVGAGIQLSPNALRVLDGLGVLDRIKLTATAPDAICILESRKARQITEVPLGAESIAKYGLPYLCLHRADLQQALLSACNSDPDISVHTNSNVKNCVEHTNGISALVYSNGSMKTRKGRFLVIADGVHSDLRNEFETMEGHSVGPVSSGYMALRAMVPAGRLPAWVNMDKTHLILGRGGHCVLYPVNGRRYLNIVLCTRQSGATATPQTITIGDIRQIFKSWNSQFHDLFDCADDWSVWPIMERRKNLFRMGDKAALIGDSAHAMKPFAAQGAAMAIEDAEVLAGCFQTEGPGENAVLRYHKLRDKRINKVRKLADNNGSLYHMGPPFSWIRNLGMKALPGQRLLARQSWIYDWRT